MEKFTYDELILIRSEILYSINAERDYPDSYMFRLTGILKKIDIMTQNER